MIIFDLDGTLADCEHRRHFVDQKKNHEKYTKEYEEKYDKFYPGPIGKSYFWQPDWQAFYEACDKDVPINQTIKIFKSLWDKYEKPIQIWSGRCESVRNKTHDWLSNIGLPVGSYLKMRPVGDSTPDDQLKEKWLDEYINSMWPKLEKDAPDGTEYKRKEAVDFVFDSDPESIKMYRSRGIFVFNCAQHYGEF